MEVRRLMVPVKFLGCLIGMTAVITFLFPYCADAANNCPRSIDRDFSIGTIQKDRGTQVTSFSATWHLPGVLIEWRLEDFDGIEGFHVLRGYRLNGKFERINSELMTVDVLDGLNKYVFWDEHAEHGKNYFYILEQIGRVGESMVHGPVLAIALGCGGEALMGQIKPSPKDLGMLTYVLALLITAFLFFDRKREGATGGTR